MYKYFAILQIPESLFSDIDECETTDSGICAGYGPNAVCINTDGSYECGCTNGYRNNGTFCESKYTYVIM